MKGIDAGRAPLIQGKARFAKDPTWRLATKALGGASEQVFDIENNEENDEGYGDEGHRGAKCMKGMATNKFVAPIFESPVRQKKYR